MNNGVKAIVAVACLGVIALAGYNFMQAQKAEREVERLHALTAAATATAETSTGTGKIWIVNEDCKTSFGPNTVAFCDGVSKDDSLFLESGADAAVKACL